MRALIALLLLLAPGPVAAQQSRALISVDVELFLAVDVSRSMSPRELEIQRRGYAEAISSKEVVRAIEDGAEGRIALTYVEWAGAGAQRVVVDWTIIDGAAAAADFAAKISAHFDPALRRTSISSALDYAAESIETNGFDGFRRVIDVSGDGPNNSGRPVADARDDALARGIAINGLPLMTKEGLGAEWHLDDLDLYYEACVIGGPTSFVRPVREWANFPAAVRDKIVQELAAAPPVPGAAPGKIHKANFHLIPRARYDCLIGEKIWDRIRRNWGYP
ncbi:MAG: DUF1194 domain-containing protein [Pseudomonadota bacterium]